MTIDTSDDSIIAISTICSTATATAATTSTNTFTLSTASYMNAAILINITAIIRIVTPAYYNSNNNNMTAAT